MDPTYRMLFDQIREALDEVREGKLAEAARTLEGILLADVFIQHYRRKDPRALALAKILQEEEACPAKR